MSRIRWRWRSSLSCSHARLSSIIYHHHVHTLVMTGVAVPSPTLASFAAWALLRTCLAAWVRFTSLHLLQRLKHKFPAARGSSGHRLFISAFMIASKVVCNDICNDTYSDKSWAVIGQGMFQPKEINQMEREMRGYLEWRLNIDYIALEEFTEDVIARFGNGVVSTPTNPTKSTAAGAVGSFPSSTGASSRRDQHLAAEPIPGTPATQPPPTATKMTMMRDANPLPTPSLALPPTLPSTLPSNANIDGRAIGQCRWAQFRHGGRLREHHWVRVEWVAHGKEGDGWFVNHR